MRRGNDVLKSLALGARVVLIGRLLYWGLAWDGEAGVSLVLEMLRRELNPAMGRCGRISVRDLDRTLIRLPVR